MFFPVIFYGVFSRQRELGRIESLVQENSFYDPSRKHEDQLSIYSHHSPHHLLLNSSSLGSWHQRCTHRRLGRLRGPRVRISSAPASLPLFNRQTINGTLRYPSETGALHRRRGPRVSSWIAKGHPPTRSKLDTPRPRQHPVAQTHYPQRQPL